jgi:outer membrane scaffolding protein for murein synthesis (MipA/OmpV family)
LLAILPLAFACLAGQTSAHQEPLWEFGLGAGVVGFPDYPGAAVTHAYPVPVPYLRYNGTFLKADRNGVRGLLFNQDWIELNVSGAGTAPVRDDAVRSGMPNLNPTLEIGPSLDLHLLRSADGRVKFGFDMPLRAAYALEPSPRQIGWVFEPRSSFDARDFFGMKGWNLGILAGPSFADRRYYGYFYGVAPQFATLTRPAYEAHGGYGGAGVLAALSKRFPDYWIGAYARLATLSGAAFEQSPLVQSRRYWSAGIGFARMIGRSTRRVDVTD